MLRKRKMYLFVLALTSKCGAIVHYKSHYLLLFDKESQVNARSVCAWLLGVA